MASRIQRLGESCDERGLIKIKSLNVDFIGLHSAVFRL